MSPKPQPPKKTRWFPRLATDADLGRTRRRKEPRRELEKEERGRDAEVVNSLRRGER